MQGRGKRSADFGALGFCGVCAENESKIEMGGRVLGFGYHCS